MEEVCGGVGEGGGRGEEGGGRPAAPRCSLLPAPLLPAPSSDYISHIDLS